MTQTTPSKNLDALFARAKASINLGNRFTTARREDHRLCKTSVLFEKMGFVFTDERDNPSKFDFMVATGGQDICPFLYGQPPLSSTHFTMARDIEELYHLRVPANGKPRIGICRGAQLLNVIEGGILNQHIQGHAGVKHKAVNVASKQSYVVNSLHHQSILPTKAWGILSMSEEDTSTETGTLASRVVRDRQKIVESLFHPGTKTYGIQSHPEYDSDWESTGTLDMFIDDLIICYPKAA